MPFANVPVAHYETLQDKLAQLKDARDALNVLRDEHREKRRREQEELERLRQIQMAQKLEVLRQKKQVTAQHTHTHEFSDQLLSADLCFSSFTCSE